ncbi:MAG: hypothetical protein EHM21_11320, partial [Chloroflexi bacterium]
MWYVLALWFRWGWTNSMAGVQALGMVQVSLRGFDKALARVKDAPKQIRFALVKTLNDAAKQTQAAVVSKLLPEKFTLRARGQPWQKPGGQLGFNIRPFAKVSGPGDPVVVLGSRADWLGLQEEGGLKLSRAGKSLAIPQEGTARPTRGDIVSRARKPRRLLARKGFFVIKTRKG